MKRSVLIPLTLLACCAGSLAQGDALYPDLKLYVASNEGNDIYVLNMDTHQVENVIDVGGRTGRFSLDGTTLTTAASKEALRDYAWVLRFARAGADATVQSLELVHAISRIDGFYFTRRSRLGGRALSEIVTSEYGVALLLDNHVNRPGYVVGCVAEALTDNGLTPDAAAAADDATERSVLRSYLTIRATYGKRPMTNAAGRAAVTREYLDAGRLSETRGSFRSNREARA